MVNGSVLRQSFKKPQQVKLAGAFFVADELSYMSVESPEMWPSSLGSGLLSIMASKDFRRL